MKRRNCLTCLRIGSPPLGLFVLLAFVVGSLAEEAPVEAPPVTNPAAFADPISTYRIYINAVR